jgi:hypothetical protein
MADDWFPAEKSPHVLSAVSSHQFSDICDLRLELVPFLQ